MNRNNDLVQYFAMQQPNLVQKLAWQATTLDEDRAWRNKFRRRLRRLVGRMPRQVPLQVEYAEEMETEEAKREAYIKERNARISRDAKAHREARKKELGIVNIHEGNKESKIVMDGTTPQEKTADATF